MISEVSSSGQEEPKDQVIYLFIEMNYDQLFAHYDQMATLDDVTPNVDLMPYTWPRNQMWQLRISRSWEELKDQYYIQHYLNTAKQSFIFQHDADDDVKRTHCHIYLFGFGLKKQSIHEYLKKYLSGNKDFAMSQTCGHKKRDLDIKGAWTYGTTDKYLEPVFTNNIQPDVLTWLRIQAIEFYNKINEAKETKKGVEIIEVVIEKEKQDNMYNRLLEDAHREFTREQLKSRIHLEWKRWVVLHYLKRGKPAPRVADGNRYAYSLWMTFKHDVINNPQGVPLDAIGLDRYS